MKNKRYRWNGIGISVVIIFVMIYGIHIRNERRQDFSPSAYRYDIELPDSPKESPDGTKRLKVGIAFDTLPGGLVHLYGSVCDVATGKEGIIYQDYCYIHYNEKTIEFLSNAPEFKWKENDTVEIQGHEIDIHEKQVYKVSWNHVYKEVH